MAKLVAEQGNSKGLTLSLEEGEKWVIGRDPDVCQLLIEDPAASRKHLVCRSSPKGIVLENLSKTNPVLVNEEVVKKPRLLKNGDAVKIGSGVFRFYAEHEVKAMNGQDTNTDVSSREDEPTHETIYKEETDEDKGILAEIDFDLRDTGRWLLKIIGGPNNGAEFSMQANATYVIGTDPNVCDVVFHDTSVSRQHARITVGKGDTLTIEDLKSRNGTLVDGEPIEGRHPLEPNTLINMGTTSFIVFDREGEMQTIISPLLPSIVKVLNKEEEKKDEKGRRAGKKETGETPAPLAAEAAKEKQQRKFGSFLLIGIITGLFILVGVGTTTLFQSKPIQIKQVVDIRTGIENALAPFPGVKYSYHPTTGLLLVGHVLTASDKNQLLYNLQGIEEADALKNLDDSGLIIDEYVWRETNQILGRDPRWKGINVHSPTAGRFVLSGYLETRKQAEELSDYFTSNFPYLDLLENRVVVEENVITSVEIELDALGMSSVDVQMTNGELTLTGGVDSKQMKQLQTLIPKFREISGVRNVKSFITELEPEQSMVNITDLYSVSGFSQQGGTNLNVVINGRILASGDLLDGMTITSIESHAIFLEKDGVNYRIDYN
ncbi:MAG: type III secretion system inner membrane ring subunit SctD [Waddliaceae bacterium]